MTALQYSCLIVFIFSLIYHQYVIIEQINIYEYDTLPQDYQNNRELIQIYQQLMINNYDRLKKQLMTLIHDPSVAQQLHPSLKLRAYNILQSSNIHSEDPLFMNDQHLQYSNNHNIQHQAQQKRNIKPFKRTNTNEKDYSKNIIKYEKINGSNLLKNIKSSSQQSKYRQGSSNKKKVKRVTGKSKEIWHKGLLRCNTESSLTKNKSHIEPVSHKKVSISSIVNRKQNFPAKYASFSHKQNHIQPKISPHHKSPFKNIKLPRQSLIHCQISHQVCQTEPSRTTSSLEKNEAHREYFIKKSATDIYTGLYEKDATNFKKWGMEESIKAFERLKQKQQGLNIQKESLQEKIKYYRWLIEAQQSKSSNLKINIQKLNTNIDQKIAEEKANKQEIKLSTKKSEGEALQKKKIKTSLQAVTKILSLTYDNIHQEKYLISMYETVIEQLKHQLKIQQNHKAALIKNLVNIKNQEKMMHQRYVYKQAFNNQIFTTLHQSFLDLQ